MKDFMLFIPACALLVLCNPVFAQQGGNNRMDEIIIGDDKINITFYGHSSLRIDYANMVIYVDPVWMYVKDKNLPKADLILVTHEHFDHLDMGLVEKLRSPESAVITNGVCAKKIKGARGISNGESISSGKVSVEAVPAYNITQGHDKFHPKGRDNGYILTLGKVRIYIAGDTEDIPEMANIKNIDIAFMPANQPYTMTPRQLDNAVEMVKPKILYPYHFGGTNVTELEKIGTENKDTEVRIRRME